jgi:beta-galactosidase
MENNNRSFDWAIYKNVDKQSVAIVQNGEYSYRKKTGEDGLPGTTWYRNKFTVPIDSREKK